MKIEKKLENKPRFFEEYKKDQELTFPADHLIGCNCNIKIIRDTAMNRLLIVLKESLDVLQ